MLKFDYYIAPVDYLMKVAPGYSQNQFFQVEQISSNKITVSFGSTLGRVLPPNNKPSKLNQNWFIFFLKCVSVFSSLVLAVAHRK